MRASRAVQKTNSSLPPEPVVMSFMGHVHELRGRLFWVAMAFIVAVGVAFPFYHQLIQILMRPLGNEKLYYLSPTGGLGFAMKICMYVGIIAIIPILIYHLYRFVAPVMPKHSALQAFRYVALSIFLAVMGIVFAYMITLPSAIHFLTNFDLGNISAMVTVDEYMSFIIAYLLAGAMLFQLPLIMVIIDSVTPTPPSSWNRFQRHMIVAAFVIAMLISPSPNITDQVLLALPTIVMYQLGIGLIWMRHRKKVKITRTSTIAIAEVDKEVRSPVPSQSIARGTPSVPSVSHAVSVLKPTAHKTRSLEGVTPVGVPAIRSVPHRPPMRPQAQQLSSHPARQLAASRRSMDIIPKRAVANQALRPCLTQRRQNTPLPAGRTLVGAM